MLVFVIYNKLFYVGFQANIISCLCSCAVFVNKLKVSEEITIFTALIWIEVWKKIFQPAVSWMVWLKTCGMNECGWHHAEQSWSSRRKKSKRNKAPPVLITEIEGTLNGFVKGNFKLFRLQNHFTMESFLQIIKSGNEFSATFNRLCNVNFDTRKNLCSVWTTLLHWHLQSQIFKNSSSFFSTRFFI